MQALGSRALGISEKSIWMLRWRDSLVSSRLHGLDRHHLVLTSVQDRIESEVDGLVPITQMSARIGA
jgi:hypothetical protein